MGAATRCFSRFPQQLVFCLALFVRGREPRVTALSGGFRRGQGYKGEEGKRRVEEATHRTTRWLDSPRASLSLCAAVRLYVPNNSYDRMYL
jgi:hypothetical protein